MPTSLFSVIVKTLEKSLLHYITQAIPHTPTQHGYKPQHSTVTTPHTVNITVEKGFNQMALPAQTINVVVDMIKAFDTINIHTLQTNIPGTIIKFIANYIKGRKTHTSYINHPSSQILFQTGVQQGGIFSPTLFNICIADILPPSALVRLMAYMEDIPITSTHPTTSGVKKYIHPYLDTWTKQNNLTLNPNKTTCTLFIQTLQSIRTIWTSAISCTSARELSVHSHLR